MPLWIRPTRHPNRGQLAVSLVTAIAIFIVVSLTWRMGFHFDDYVDASLDSTAWTLSRTENEALRLDFELDLANHHPEKSLETARQRFDILYSRIMTITEGRALGGVDSGGAIEGLRRALRDYLAQAVPLMDGDERLLRGALLDLMVKTRILSDTIRRVSITVMQEMSQIDDIRRARFQRLVWGSLCAALTVIAALFLWARALQRLRVVAEDRAAQISRLAAERSQIIDASLDPIIVLDQAGRVKRFNPAAALVFGCEREAAVGLDFAQLLKAQDLTRLLTSAQGRVEAQAIRHSGESFPVELSVSRNETEGGLHFTVFLRDMSLRAAQERAIVAARDAALASDKAKSDFLTVMSHEMRTPLNGIFAALEVMERDAPSPWLAAARLGAAQILDQVNSVLDLTAANADGMAIKSQSFDLRRTVMDEVDRLQPLTRGNRIEAALLNDLPPLYGDPLRLGQVLRSLVANALAVSEAAAILVEAEVIEVLQGQVVLEFRVSDSGPGIPEEDQQRIFHEFVGVDPGCDHSHGGIGLAACRRIVEAMQGEIGVESAPGEGSCFWFRLTLPHGQDMAPPGTEVLLVEDNDINRVVVAELLRGLGHVVTTCCDGQEACDLARARRYDVILMDISMRGMDGVTATGVIRQKGASRDTRIIALTAHSLPADLERFRAAGFDAHLAKPVTRDALRLVLTAQGHTEAPAPEDQGLPFNPDRWRELGQALGDRGRRGLVDNFLTWAKALPERLAATSEQDPAFRELLHEAIGVAATLGLEPLHAMLRQLHDGPRSSLVTRGDFLGHLDHVATAVRRFHPVP
ncbi:response regulator [Rhodobacter sp. KR11]|nr:response regulator [Rhodobacter sp. KR11]